MIAGGPLAGRVAIVTGASSGIGRDTCVSLARAGAIPVLVGRDAGRLAATADAVVEAGMAAPLLLPLDVRVENDMARMAAATLERHGRIDILVHAAGILRAAGSTLRTVAQLSCDEWDEVVDTNLRGTYFANRAVLPAMLQAGRGDILNVSSKSGRQGIAFDAPYCASKFGVIGFSESLAEEVAGAGVRVQVMAPGRFATEVLRQTGPLPTPGGIPPGSRVADVIVWMLSMPADVRMACPILEGVGANAAAGAMAAKGSAAPTGRHSANLSQPESTMRTNVTRAATDLRGKVVIVSGGAGGIGFATACAVGELGGTVVVADLDAARVEAAATEIAGLGAAATLGVAIDVRREEDHARLVQTTLERFGRIDALIVCAGILRKRGTAPKLAVDTGVDEWDDVMAINLRGVFLANRAVLPTMVSQRAGLIVNVSSVQGLQGRAYDSPYCASKFGVIGLTQAVADEVKSFGVKVQALMPGAVATPFWEQNLPAPMPGDAMPPERVADLIVFMLLQPEDSMLVGPVITPVGARRRKAAAKAVD
ncbi:MAG: SDR family oxidoreductase [Burkholderiales bacterium]|nr:SDR family oxidoreductase [Burkholderiales bacterium]